MRDTQAIKSNSIHTKFLAGFVMFNILLSSLTPKLAIKINYDELSKIMASQSILSDFFYHSTLPIKIANKIIAKYLMSQNSMSSKPCVPYSNQGNSNDNSTNTSAESAIVKTSNNSSIVKNNNNTGTNKQIHMHISEYMKYNPSALTNNITQRFKILSVFIIMFFFLLPRSSITVDKIIRIIEHIRNPIWRNSNWVFSLHNNPPISPFFKGGFTVSPFSKGGFKGDLLFSSKTNNQGRQS